MIEFKPGTTFTAKQRSGDTGEYKVTAVRGGKVYFRPVGRDWYDKALSRSAEKLASLALTVTPPAPTPPAPVDTGPKMSKTAARSLWKKASDAGMTAARGHTPTPMVVAEHASPLNDASPVTKAWLVNEGACGFGWVKIRPANGRFAKWLLANGIAHRDEYAGGVNISAPASLGQSFERQQKWAYAAADVLRAAGVNAYGHVWLD